MQVTLLDYTPDAENFIGRCASICYDSDTTKTANLRRAAACVSKGHLATLRFAWAVFNVSGISRACSHQFVRSKHLDFLQRSQRYCKEDDPEFYYPGTTCDTVLSGAYQSALAYYNDLLKLGVKKEDARLVLPAGVTTELNVSGNFQAWRDFLKLRTHDAAQKEIRQVALEIGLQLWRIAPNIFPEYGDVESSTDAWSYVVAKAP
jgi:thymidylate synthase (FAD)